MYSFAFIRIILRKVANSATNPELFLEFDRRPLYSGASPTSGETWYLAVRSSRITPDQFRPKAKS